MLQDMTKSALSLSWALSLLGVKQAMNMVQPNQQPTNVFGPLAQAAAEQLDDSMKDIYRSGEQIQVRMVDMAFTVLRPGASVNPMNPSAPPGTGMPGMPADGGAGAPAGGPMAAIGAMINMMNPMNLMNMMRGKQNCGPCGQGGPGQQP